MLNRNLQIVALVLIFSVVTIPVISAENSNNSKDSIDAVIDSHRAFLAEFDELLEKSSKKTPVSESVTSAKKRTTSKVEDPTSTFSIISSQPKILRIKETSDSDKSVKKTEFVPNEFAIFVTPEGGSEVETKEVNIDSEITADAMPSKSLEKSEEANKLVSVDANSKEESDDDSLTYDHGYVGDYYAGDQALEEEGTGIKAKLKDMKYDILKLFGVNETAADIDQFADYELDEYKDAADKESKTIDTYFQLSTGYRVDDLQWSIASDITGNATPNILSELTWDDVETFYVQANGQMTFLDHYVIDGLVGYGWIQNGDNQDSDYLGNDRTLEFSRSNNSVDDDYVFDISGGLGYKIDLGSKYNLFLEVQDLDLTFLAGYSYHEQNFNITDGFQTIPAAGPFPGLDSTYETEWEGPWVGFELTGLKGKFSGAFRFEYHFVDYYAEANWNLRTDFAHPTSFTHDADGWGIVFRLGGSYHFTDDFSLDINYTTQDWETDDGLDRLFFANGNVVDTRLNEVSFETHAILIGATYYFN